MKHLKSLLALAMFSFLLVSCTQDNEVTDASLDLTAKVSTSIKDQVTRTAFDTEDRGIYNGIIASGNTLSRGKTWINLGNDGQYSALVEMVGGEVFKLQLANNKQEATPSKYAFKGQGGSFMIDVSNPLTPLITEVKLNNLPYFSRVEKSVNGRGVLATTGTFAENAGAGASGTWSFIAAGAVNPNGTGGQAITSVTVTAGGSMWTDTMMETGNTCIWVGGVPQYGDDFDVEGLWAGGQFSMIGGTNTAWDIGYGFFFGAYVDPACNTATSGSWSKNMGARTGTINIDGI